MIFLLTYFSFFRRGNSTNYLYKNSVSKRKIFTYGSDPTTLFLGGVIVLIIYIRTLSANEKFSPMVVTLPLFVLLALIMSITSNSLTQSFSNRVTSRSFISQLYQHKNARLLLFLIVYLLITLVCVVKLVKYEEGPLSKRL